MHERFLINEFDDEIHGPYETDEDREAAAAEMFQEQDDGYWVAALDIIDGKPSVWSFSSHFVDTALGLNDYEDEEDENWFENHYVCSNCGCEWTDEWSCMCDDDCPECGTTMTVMSAYIRNEDGSWELYEDNSGSQIENDGDLCTQCGCPIDHNDPVNRCNKCREMGG